MKNLKKKDLDCERLEVEAGNSKKSSYRRNGESIHNIWLAMHRRCSNPNDKSYSNYGGRDIKVCDRWLKFENFLADMGERPQKMTLDRIDVNGNYEPSNCRWASMKDQNNNRRDNTLITHDGRTQTLSMWADETGIRAGTIAMRLKKYGWTIEKSLTNEAGSVDNSRCHYLTYNGKTLTITQWAKESGISRYSINSRLKLGWSVEKTLSTRLEKGRRPDNKLLTSNGVTLSVSEWASRIGIKKETLFSRINNGWDDDKILNTPVKPQFSRTKDRIHG